MTIAGPVLSDRAVAKVFGPAVFEVAQDIDRRAQLRCRFFCARQPVRLRGIEFDQFPAECLAFIGQRDLYGTLVMGRPLLDDIIRLDQLLDVV